MEERGGFVKTMWCGDEACEMRYEGGGGRDLPLHPLCSRSIWAMSAPSAVSRP